MNSDKTLYGVVMGSEERSVDEIDLYSELLEGGVLFLKTHMKYWNTTKIVTI